MIELVDLTKRYGDKLAVDGLTLDVGQGEVCVLIGPSGCGKTTTLRMINRLIEPTSGTVILGGHDTSKVKLEELRRGIGYAIQSVGLFPHMTVGDNIAVVPRLLGWDQERREARVAELLALTGLDPEEYAEKYPAQLSGGQAQRVGVARALAADPPVLLMDEPFGAVDPLTRELLQGEFARIQRELKKTVVLVTHDLDEAIRLADRLAIMRDGRIAQYDRPETVLAEPADEFVRDFVGADRALKGLSRIAVDVVMQPARSIVIEAAAADVVAMLDDPANIWAVDEPGILQGWVSKESLRDGASLHASLVLSRWEEAAVRPESTLKDALSRIVAQGFGALPVVDEAGRLVGEITLEAFAKVTAGEVGPGRSADTS